MLTPFPCLPIHVENSSSHGVLYIDLGNKYFCFGKWSTFSNEISVEDISIDVVLFWVLYN